MTSFYFYLLVAQFIVSLIIFVVLLFIVAPYGRHAKISLTSKTMLTPRVGWVIIEGPALTTILLVSLLIFYQQRYDVTNNLAWAPFVFLGLWEFHYIYRFFIYPFLLKRKAHSMPLGIVLGGVVFNIFNGFINAWWLMKVKHYFLSEFTSPHFIIGISLFFIGFITHVYSDHQLRVASEHESSYIIPKNFPHTLICSPNYLGEIIQWIGWAIATWSLAGFSFAIFTAANLIPRALKHLHWYRKTFSDFPTQRKAIFPFIL